MNYTKGNMVAVRNIALSYTFPEKWLGKIGANSCQIYGQVLNLFIWGGDLVKAGINPAIQLVGELKVDAVTVHINILAAKLIIQY